MSTSRRISLFKDHPAARFGCFSQPIISVELKIGKIGPKYLITFCPTRDRIKILYLPPVGDLSFSTFGLDVAWRRIGSVSVSREGRI
jgi:hypothetical protein